VVGAVVCSAERAVCERLAPESAICEQIARFEQLVALFEQLATSFGPLVAHSLAPCSRRVCGPFVQTVFVALAFGATLLGHTVFVA